MGGVAVALGGSILLGLSRDQRSHLFFLRNWPDSFLAFYQRASSNKDRCVGGGSYAKTVATRPQGAGGQVKIYVASSWRNEFQPGVVSTLRADGHEVYDFKDSEGFHWTEVDPDWQQWPSDIPKYLLGLEHPCAQRGYTRDMNALVYAEACVMVMPCGMSASLEAGFAIGKGKPTIVYVPAMREPDLMVKMAALVTSDFDAVRSMLRDEDAYRRRYREALRG